MRRVTGVAVLVLALVIVVAAARRVLAAGSWVRTAPSS